MQHAHELALFQKKQHHIDDRNTHQGQDQFLKRFSIRQYSTATHSVSHVAIPISTSVQFSDKDHESADSSSKASRSFIKRANFANSASKHARFAEMDLDEQQVEKSSPVSSPPPPQQQHAVEASPQEQINNLIQIERSNAINSARHSLKKMENIRSMQMSHQARFSVHSKASTTLSNHESPLNDDTDTHLSFYANYLIVKLNYFVISPDETCMFAWLIVLTVCTLYNLWFIIARQSFELLQVNYASYFQVADAVADLIYLLDILVQFRTGYLEQGLLVYDSKKLAKNYVKSQNFLLDIFSILPLELLELHLGYKAPMLRFPRYFKLYRSFQLAMITESRTLYPNVWRVTILTHILLLLGHWFAGFYFLISKAEGFKG